jgi:DnaA family protein
MKGAQLALPVQLSQAPTFDSFFAGPNDALVEALRAIAKRTSPVPAAWLYGAASSGKTHLLRATVSAAGESAVYSPAAIDPVRLSALADAPLLALDDVDPALADETCALSLLRLIDRRRERRLPLLLAGNGAPARMTLLSADLRSRLEAMALLGLKPLRESDRRELLRLQAQQRGLDLSDEVVDWLIARLRRDAGTLISALDEVDRASLSAKRRVTLPFVQQVLGPLLQPSLPLQPPPVLH